MTRDIKTPLVVSFSVRVALHFSPLAAFRCQGSSKDFHYLNRFCCWPMLVTDNGDRCGWQRIRSESTSHRCHQYLSNKENISNIIAFLKMNQSLENLYLHFNQEFIISIICIFLFKYLLGKFCKVSVIFLKQLKAIKWQLQ